VAGGVAEFHPQLQTLSRATSMNLRLLRGNAMSMGFLSGTTVSLAKSRLTCFELGS
jgi:hypothetical protein